MPDPQKSKKKVQKLKQQPLPEELSRKGGLSVAGAGALIDRLMVYCFTVVVRNGEGLLADSISQQTGKPCLGP